MTGFLIVKAKRVTGILTEEGHALMKNTPEPLVHMPTCYPFWGFAHVGIPAAGGCRTWTVRVVERGNDFPERLSCSFVSLTSSDRSKGLACLPDSLIVVGAGHAQMFADICARSNIRCETRVYDGEIAITLVPARRHELV